MKQAKYLDRSKPKKKPWLIPAALVLIAIGVVGLRLLKPPAMEEQKETEGTEASASAEASLPEQETDAPVTYTQLQTAYLTLPVPEDILTALRHQEVTQDDVSMEVFSMVFEERETELFRICFGDAQFGKQIGYLQVEQRDIPITLQICEYEEGYFGSEEERLAYYQAMDCLNGILKAIQEDSRFCEDLTEAPTEQKDVAIAAWNFQLPDTVEYEETESGDSYLLTFYTTIRGDRQDLYRIAIGEETLSSVLGTYLWNDEERQLSVESFPLPEMEGWSASDADTLYIAMDSINDVIATIMQAPGFSQGEAQ